MTKKLQNMSKYPKCKISRKAKKNGSIFSIICIARRALHKHGLNAEAEEMATKYGDYALNIYTGCPHRCFYCYAPNVLHRDRQQFHEIVEPRKNIVEETRKQIEREKITGKLIHLCFTCDPYPHGYDTTATREIIPWLFRLVCR